MLVGLWHSCESTAHAFRRRRHLCVADLLHSQPLKPYCLHLVKIGRFVEEDPPLTSNFFPPLCQCHDATSIDYRDNGGSEGTSRVCHRIELLCITKARQLWTWADFEVFCSSRKEKVFLRLSSFCYFTVTGLPLNWQYYLRHIYCLSVVFAVPESLSITALILLPF